MASKTTQVYFFASTHASMYYVGKFLFRKVSFLASFSLVSFVQQLTLYKCCVYNLKILDSNHILLGSKATSIPNEPQLLPTVLIF